MDDLQELRWEIDHIDMQIIDLLVQRFSAVQDIGQYKKIHGFPFLDQERQDKHVKALIAEAKKQWLSEKCVSDLWDQIYRESLQVQK